MEIYKKIKDFSNYEISNLGNVKSLSYNNTGKERLLKPKINKQGHLEVTLNKNDKHHYRMVSRLVLETFLGLELGRNDIVMYKDNDKTNCHLDNMYVISRGKRQEITYDLEHRDRLLYEYYDEILPTKEISKRTGIDSKTIRTRMKKLYWNIYEASEIPLGIYKERIK